MKQQPIIIVRKDRSKIQKPLIDLTIAVKEMTTSIKKSGTLKLKPKAQQSNKKERYKQQAIVDRKMLQDKYPDIFNVISPKPLAIGIHTQIRQLFDVNSGNRTRRLLYWWCHQKKYIKCISQYPHRFNLDGSVVISDGSTLANNTEIHNDTATEELTT